MRTVLKSFLVGVMAGAIVALLAAGLFYKFGRDLPWERVLEKIERKIAERAAEFEAPRTLQDDLSQLQGLTNDQRFGTNGWLTAQVFGKARLEKSGDKKMLIQISDSYRDSAVIRSTGPLPPAYRLTVVAGGIDYGLEKIQGQAPDPEFSEGPLNENGCYLLTITDTPPVEPHTNIWWHQHRKVTMDVDNNVWGHGMPNPIFMVYFNRDNRLTALNGKTRQWGREWESAIHYDPEKFYKMTIEKTTDHYQLELAEENGKVLHRARVPVKDVWRGQSPEYFVLGDPHMNYYQGSMKVKQISLTY